ncbi:MAG: hypothetical protein JRE40_15560 [Deltaproteobacteria bacterium]|nr:hypothetical protein [Deltaproteobacteria bacterium]
MLTVQIITLPNGKTYVALTSQKGSLLFEQEENGHYRPIADPDFGNFSKDDIYLEQRTWV